MMAEPTECRNRTGSKKNTACKKEEGAITLTAILVLAFACFLTISAAAIAMAQKNQLRAFKRTTARVQELTEAADMVLALLSEEEPDAPDWRGSSFFSAIAEIENETGFSIVVEDLSSRFNLNSLNKKMITETQIQNSMLPGTGADAFQQDRSDRGFGLSPLPRWEDFFTREFLENYAACTGGWNINTADEFSLEAVFAEVTGDETAAELFHEKIREKRKSLELIPAEKLEEFIGIQYFSGVYPVIHAFPEFNVHFAPEWVLKQILAYPAYKVADPAATAEMLISLRDSRGLSREEIISLIPIQPDPDETTAEKRPKEENRLFAWLGNTTLFWRITVQSKENENSEKIMIREIALIPDSRGMSGAHNREYRIINEELPW